jgi:hypothetical protein
VIKVGGIELYVGPSPLGAPGDLEAVICNFIENAPRSQNG